jgi:zinc-binding alcohol dehydrogenase/oxidoreductase
MMKALIHEGPQGMAGVRFGEIEQRDPGPGEVKVALKAAGLNHRDLFVLFRRKKDANPPLVLGSDGAGVVAAVGEGVTDVMVGDEVIINPSLNWPHKSDAPPPGFEILGLPDHGTFAESVIVPKENVFAKPAYLTWEEAGVFALAALTAYRALFTRGNVQAGQTVLIPGIGSGAATFLLQMAKAAGARVIVTSRSEEKRARALALGAALAIDSESEWSALLQDEKVDLVIESVGQATWDKSLSVLRKGGTIVTFGASAGDEVKLNLRTFFYGQYNLLGTTMGSGEEFREMLQFCQTHNIKPVIDRVYPLSEGKSALERMEMAKQFGKIALQID